MFRTGSALLLLILAPAAALAQPGPPQVINASHRDTSLPLRDLPPAARHVGDLEAEPVRQIPSRRNPLGPDQVVQPATAPTLQTPSTIRNFDGVGQGFKGPAGTFVVNSAPPDPNGAVGITQYLETVNGDLAVFDKATGSVTLGPVPINTLWSGFGGECEARNDGDPTVVFDHLANRWVVAQFAVSSTPFLQCVAVSQSADATGGYYRYSFAYGSDFPDYPKMGVWPDGYYTTYNMFNAAGTAFLGAKVCAFDRARMLSGAAATQVCFNTSTAYGGLLPADLDGATGPPAGAPNYLIALGATSTTLAMWRFHVDFAVPASSTFSGPLAIGVPDFVEACSGAGGTCIPQSGGGRLDSLSDRLMYRAAYRNFGSRTSLVVNHAVTAGASVGIRWYEIQNLEGTPAAVQYSTYAPDATYRWMGSVAMDQRGNMALGYSASSSSIVPQIRFTGRLAGDPVNEMTQAEGTFIAGTGAQRSTLTRWGDYSSMSIDPVDDCTFWYTAEYLKTTGTFNWSTRVASFAFPDCPTTPAPGFSLSASPTTVTAVQGASGTSAINVAAIGGFAGTVTFGTTGLPAGVTAAFNPGSSQTGSTLTITVPSSGVPAGSYTFNVTGTDGSVTHTTPVTLAVTAAVPATLTLTASPTSAVVARGANVDFQIGIARGGFTGPVTLSATGAPSRSSVSFSPASATGGASTMTFSTQKPVKAGTYTLTITGTGGGTTGTTTVTMTIQ